MPLFDAYTINNTGLVNAMVQNVVDSPYNSSTAVLAPTAYFTGTGTSTLGVAGIQVSLYANQNCSVYVEQSPDNTNWDISDIYYYKYQTNPNFGITVQAVSSYFRVRVLNESPSSSATTFRLQSCLCPIVEVVPRSLSSEGHLKVGVYEIEDLQDNVVKISPLGGLNTTKMSRLVGTTFNGTTVDSSFWQTSAVAGASAVQVGGEFSLNTNASTTGAAAYIQSVRSARYISGNPHYVRMIVDYGSATSTTNTKRWGAWTSSAVGAYNSPQDGCAFEIINGTLSVATYNSGSATRITNGNFNGRYGTILNEVPGGTLTYEIIYTNSKVQFFAAGDLVHAVSATGAPWSSTLTLPFRGEIYNTNVSGNVNTSLKLRTAAIHRFGELSTAPQWVNVTAGATASILKRSAGRLQKIIINSTAGTLTLYDALTGTNPILSIDTAKAAPGSFAYDIDFYTGLCYTSTSTGNFTIVYE